MKVVVIALFASLVLAVVPARADDPQFMILDGAKRKSPAYIDFFKTFSTTFIEQVAKNVEQNLAPDHWVILLSRAFSPTGEILVTIYAIRDGEESEPPILVAVLSERSDDAVIRTAARSAQRLIVETAARQRETPPRPPTPGAKAQDEQPPHEDQCGGFLFYAIVK